MNYEQKKLEPIPPQKGLNDIELKVYSLLPDLWGDCASTRSRKRYKRYNMYLELVKQQEQNDTAAATAGI